MERGHFQAEEELRDMETLTPLGEEIQLEDAEERRAVEILIPLIEEPLLGVSGEGGTAAVSSSSDRGQLEVVLATPARSEHLGTARLEDGLPSQTSPLTTAIIAQRQIESAEQAERFELNEIDRSLEGVHGMFGTN
jgi:hypothetical protein